MMPKTYQLMTTNVCYSILFLWVRNPGLTHLGESGSSSPRRWLQALGQGCGPLSRWQAWESPWQLAGDLRSSPPRPLPSLLSVFMTWQLAPPEASVTDRGREGDATCFLWPPACLTHIALALLGLWEVSHQVQPALNTAGLHEDSTTSRQGTDHEGHLRGWHPEELWC